MARVTPILAGEKTAAKLLVMKPAELPPLVQAGHLSRRHEIASAMVRWDAEAIRQIGRGDAVEGGIEWWGSETWRG